MRAFLSNNTQKYIILMGLQYLVDVPGADESKLPSNYISTTKYNLITFFPLALALQFKRYANIYFLICAIMQSIPLISPLSPFSAVAPLIFVLFLSMAREGFEDYKRWKSDRLNNEQLTSYFDGFGFSWIEWKALKRGNLVKVSKDEILPVDMIALICSSPSGIAYVETASLDGEKNLKPKFCIPKAQLKYNVDSNLTNIGEVKAKLICNLPSAEIETFEGKLEINLLQENYNEQLNKKNMMLRGCKLKNTEWVIGLTVYTGEDTAIMMNGSKPFTKISNIERKVNNIILVILVFEVLCSLGSGIYCYFGCLQNYPFEQLINNTASVNCLSLAGISFGSYFILYSTFIPISLIVSLQFVKVFQGYFMGIDRQMYCHSNKRSMECHTVSINQQLGQIQYILTDKTGTLTCNKMQFKNVVIGTEIYGEHLTHNPQTEKFDFTRLSHRYEPIQKELQKEHFDSRGLSFDLSHQEKGPQNQKQKSKKNLIELMFFMIATCHECVRSIDGGFEGPSPDEVALLNAAQQVGFLFKSNENKMITVEYSGKEYKYEVLRVVEFDSDRKRMSVVVKKDKVISVYVKGADSNIEKLLAPHQKYLQVIKEKTNELTRTGLRSLWFAYKILPENVDASMLSVEEIENHLTLVGATGIQDKLQDYVAETIFSLREGGIKFIMLTGDKLQTAENIALSCKLIEDGYLIRNVADLKSFADYLRDLLETNHQIEKSPVIDGSTLAFADSETELLFIISKVKSVVFCRVTPGQKADIVRLVKKLGKLTLAIGDGANDVNMIMEAHVGVGIFGEEGTRAAQVANYAIGEFCLLWKLLLYYGRLNYMRVTEMVLYFFYKNMVFTIIQFAYCFYNIGSGESFWLSWSITFYNMVFTFFPVVIRAVFQNDIQITPNKKTFEELSKGTHEQQTLYSYYPKMYRFSQNNQNFTNLIFFTWFVLGIGQGVVCLLITLYSLGDQYHMSGYNSYQIGFYYAQISAYTSVIVVVTVKLAINVKHWNLVLVIGFVIPSLGAYILFMFLSSYFEQVITYKSTSDLLSMPIFYVVQVLCIGLMFTIDLLLFSIESTRHNFQNYMKYRYLKDKRLSVSHLNNFMLEMQTTDERRMEVV